MAAAVPIAAVQLDQTPGQSAGLKMRIAGADVPAAVVAQYVNVFNTRHKPRLTEILGDEAIRVGDSKWGGAEKMDSGWHSRHRRQVVNSAAEAEAALKKPSPRAPQHRPHSPPQLSFADFCRAKKTSAVAADGPAAQASARSERREAPSSTVPPPPPPPLPARRRRQLAAELDSAVEGVSRRLPAVPSPAASPSPPPPRTTVNAAIEDILADVDRRAALPALAAAPSVEQGEVVYADGVPMVGVNCVREAGKPEGELTIKPQLPLRTAHQFGSVLVPREGSDEVRAVDGILRSDRVLHDERPVPYAAAPAGRWKPGPVVLKRAGLKSLSDTGCPGQVWDAPTHSDPRQEGLAAQYVDLPAPPPAPPQRPPPKILHSPQTSRPKSTLPLPDGAVAAIGEHLPIAAEGPTIRIASLQQLPPQPKTAPASGTPRPAPESQTLFTPPPLRPGIGRAAELKQFFQPKGAPFKAGARIPPIIKAVQPKMLTFLQPSSAFSSPVLFPVPVAEAEAPSPMATDKPAERNFEEGEAQAEPGAAAAEGVPSPDETKREPIEPPNLRPEVEEGHATAQGAAGTSAAPDSPAVTEVPDEQSSPQPVPQSTDAEAGEADHVRGVSQGSQRSDKVGTSSQGPGYSPVPQWSDGQVVSVISEGTTVPSPLRPQGRPTGGDSPGQSSMDGASLLGMLADHRAPGSSTESSTQRTDVPKTGSLASRPGNRAVYPLPPPTPPPRPEVDAGVCGAVVAAMLGAEAVLEARREVAAAAVAGAVAAAAAGAVAEEPTPEPEPPSPPRRSTASTLSAKLLEEKPAPLVQAVLDDDRAPSPFPPPSPATTAPYRKPSASTVSRPQQEAMSHGSGASPFGDEGVGVRDEQPQALVEVGAEQPGFTRSGFAEDTESVGPEQALAASEKAATTDPSPTAGLVQEPAAAPEGPSTSPDGASRHPLSTPSMSGLRGQEAPPEIGIDDGERRSASTGRSQSPMQGTRDEMVGSFRGRKVTSEAGSDTSQPIAVRKGGRGTSPPQNRQRAGLGASSVLRSVSFAGSDGADGQHTHGADASPRPTPRQTSPPSLHGSPGSRPSRRGSNLNASPVSPTRTASVSGAHRRLSNVGQFVRRSSQRVSRRGSNLGIGHTNAMDWDEMRQRGGFKSLEARLKNVLGKDANLDTLADLGEWKRREVVDELAQTYNNAMLQGTKDAAAARRITRRSSISSNCADDEFTDSIGSRPNSQGRRRLGARAQSLSLLSGSPSRGERTESLVVDRGQRSTGYGTLGADAPATVRGSTVSPSVQGRLSARERAASLVMLPDMGTPQREKAESHRPASSEHQRGVSFQHPRPTVSTPPPLGPCAEQHAVCVGIEVYKDRRLQNCSHTVSDTLALGTLLEHSGYSVDFLHSRVADARMRPTRANILRVINQRKEQLARIESPDKVLLIYFTGLANYGPVLQGALTFDSLQGTSPMKFYFAAEDTRVPASGNFSSDTVVVIDDLCQQHKGAPISGSDHQGADVPSPRSREPFSAARFREEQREESARDPIVVVDAYGMPGCTRDHSKQHRFGFGLITGRQMAGGEFSVRYGPRHNGGLLTYYVMKALEGGATRDGRLTNININTYLKAKLSQHVRDDFIQTNANTLQRGDVEVVNHRRILKTRRELQDAKEERRLVPCKFALEASATFGWWVSAQAFKTKLLACVRSNMYARDFHRSPASGRKSFVGGVQTLTRRRASHVGLSRKASTAGPILGMTDGRVTMDTVKQIAGLLKLESLALRLASLVPTRRVVVHLEAVAAEDNGHAFTRHERWEAELKEWCGRAVRWTHVETACVVLIDVGQNHAKTLKRMDEAWRRGKVRKLCGFGVKAVRHVIQLGFWGSVRDFQKFDKASRLGQLDDPNCFNVLIHKLDVWGGSEAEHIAALYVQKMFRGWSWRRLLAKMKVIWNAERNERDAMESEMPESRENLADAMKAEGRQVFCDYEETIRHDMEEWEAEDRGFLNKKNMRSLITNQRSQHHQLHCLEQCARMEISELMARAKHVLALEAGMKLAGTLSRLQVRALTKLLSTTVDEERRGRLALSITGRDWGLSVPREWYTGR
eukprot:TRINITY_DN11342_c0_g1_i1.p1 TRINITY_DN11342_c0_g1~~TRINITY_DN11342_c0_g1_i1.p1  ORF type:complete len:2090 (+),score=458.83 TRINITY_DN11342_c0_g1_i1:56-6271(+)